MTYHLNGKLTPDNSNLQGKSKKRFELYRVKLATKRPEGKTDLLSS